MDDAKRIEEALKHRLNECGLEIHPTKSRNISFGRFERQNAIAQKRNSNTFDFLGFTHYCDVSRKGKFKIGRKTCRKKYSAKCKEMNAWLKAIRNKVKTKDWWKTLASKLRGHFQYYGISENYESIVRFYKFTIKTVKKWLNRRSQKRKMNWDRFTSYLEQLPVTKAKNYSQLLHLTCKVNCILKSRMWEIHKSGSVRDVEVALHLVMKFRIFLRRPY